MAGSDAPSTPAMAPSTASRGRRGLRLRDRYSLLTRRDKLLLTVMVAVPLVIELVFIWGPAGASVVFSLTDWRGIGPLGESNFVGLGNYETLVSSYPFFWPALWHNVIWFAFLMVVATPLGVLLAVLLDNEIRGSWFYQTAFYIPVVLSLAVIGIIWTFQFQADNGFINTAIGRTDNDNLIDWFGDRNLNIWAALVATGWRHVGYIMLLYLAGLKSVDPALREAAKIDGATERQTFRHVVFPVMQPINIVIVVITTIEALRAFDIAYIINKGKNGLELLSTLITNNALTEANLVGFGSAIAVVLLLISLPPIVYFLYRTNRGQT